MKPFADLGRLVNAVNVAVVGASPRPASQGGRLYENMLRHSALKGTVYAVNPAYTEIDGAACWPSISALPEDARVDVALIIVNGALVLGILKECVERGIPFAIVMSSGFSEAGGDEGRQREREIAQLCADTGLHVYGPNCPGFVNVRDRLGMTFSPAFKNDLHSGRIGLATQGGGLGRNLLQGLSAGPGVGLWFSAGNEVDLDVPDFIAHMANDPDIDVIGVLMEGVKDGRRLAAALELARAKGKPVAMLKVGHSEAGARAAQSHTAAIAGSAAINSAVFGQYGVVEVRDLGELLSTVYLLSRGAPRAGTGLCIYTFSGGTAALAADIAGTAELPMATFTAETASALRDLLPGFAAIDNPVDTTADILRNQDAATECLRLVSNDPNVGAVLFPIPMDYGEVTDRIAQSIVEVSRSAAAPIIPVWMSRRLGQGFQLMEEHGLLPFYSLADAVGALKVIWPASTSPGAGGQASAPVADAESPAGAGQHQGGAPLSEAQSKQLLREAGIALPESGLAADAEQAVAIQQRLGGPVVMKIVSPDIVHKTDAGGVKLGLRTADEVREAYAGIMETVGARAPHARIDGVLVEAMLPGSGREVLIGVHHDDAFGPVMTFGLGGIFVEILRDVTHCMLPLGREEARAMIGRIRHARILHGVRGQGAADLQALEDLILKVSDFAYRNRERIREIELNPVWVGPEGAGAIPLDALVIEH
ncbi:acetate--CoA ligase family protein [Alcaligenaceae bacterium]|nr:acetate--CoA ligase family protein [Alcaligenaceae bacterium]